ncbi:MAG: PhzF family phenazine biosynthesis protein [Candidatus Cloacimonadaceae bacterium]|nr:PhzF family phenazine biosynthesis protein [Candidatus Cloacimonadaceae bacterium]MDP3115323.1 PhzF family phenazine biosynthesis protein [Candidatus Cloacimonadaceae bacterium]
MKDPVYFVNAFSENYYTGNTAAVVLVEEYPSDGEMLALAAEFGFSETAFLQRIGAGEYQIRWFTPEVEVSLCGHATLASAKSLFAFREKDADLLTFQSLSGRLTARRKEGLIELDFPLETSVQHTVDAALLQALSPLCPMEILSAGASRNLILVYPDAQNILDMRPDFEALAAMKDLPYFGIAVTSSGYFDYVCRYFAPWEGINEDPVTGSAQTYLAPYWSAKLNKTILKGYQASRRGGDFEVEVLNSRVLIRGKAFIYLSGDIDTLWRRSDSAVENRNSPPHFHK